MLKNKKVNVTLIELLCIIFILIVFIMLLLNGISQFVDVSRNEQIIQKEKLAISATKKYVNSNDSFLNMSVGEVSYLSLGDLDNNNLLPNKSLQYCTDKSYVRINKLSDDEYGYVPYIYCDDDIDLIERVPSPMIDLTFSDMGEDTFQLKIIGGNTTGGLEINLLNYSFSIFGKKNNSDDWEECYSSPIIDSKGVYSLVSNEKLVNYVSKDYSEIKLKVRASNVVGTTQEVSSVFKNKQK